MFHDPGQGFGFLWNKYSRQSGPHSGALDHVIMIFDAYMMAECFEAASSTLKSTQRTARVQKNPIEGLQGSVSVAENTRRTILTSSSVYAVLSRLAY